MALTLPLQFAKETAGDFLHLKQKTPTEYMLVRDRTTLEFVI